MDGDVGESALVGHFSPLRQLRPSVPWDVLVLVFWWGRSKKEGLYPVQAVGVFPGPVGQDVYAWCKVFVQPTFALFSVYFPDPCVYNEIDCLSTVLDSVGINESRISVVLH